MRPLVAWANAHLPRGVRAALLVAFASAGCSLLLAHDASQCSRDADCEALGLAQATCDVATKVCKLPSGGGGQGGDGAGSGGGAAGRSGGAGTAGSVGGTALAGGEAGMPDGGSAAHGGAIDVAGSGGSGGSMIIGGSGGKASGGSGSGGAAPVPNWTTLPKVDNAVRVRVRSFCSGPLWLHVANANTTLMPDDVQLTTGNEQSYSAPLDWAEARVAAFGTGPRLALLDKVDLSITGGTSYYSLQYLDGFGLPMQVGGFGGTCTAQQTKTCNARQKDVATCPENFLQDGARCVSASVYCQVPANQTSAYCHALDAAIAGCSGCPGGTTPEVYAGSGPYAAQARLGAALNRGMLSAPDSTDASKFFTQPPYNTYARWVHGLCPDIMSFPNDFYGASGVIYPNCSGTELRITFCPAR